MSFRTLMNNMVSGVSELYSKYAPTALSSEKQFGKGIVTSCALIAIADGEVEDSELDFAAEFIDGIDDIVNYLGAEEAHEILSLQINSLETAYKKGTAMFTLTVNKMISEIKANVTDPGQREVILGIAASMTESNSKGVAGEDETKMLNKLNQAIGE
jgi:tellurite resistance protein